MTQGQRRPFTLLREADQRTVAVLTALCLILVVINLALQGYQRGQLIEIDDAPPIKFDFVLDVNRADWPEFTLLPGIGETLAKRIIQYRQQHGPFTSIDHIERVKGIGPKTMRRIREFLIVGETNGADEQKNIEQGTSNDEG